MKICIDEIYLKLSKVTYDMCTNFVIVNEEKPKPFLLSKMKQRLPFSPGFFNIVFETSASATR